MVAPLAVGAGALGCDRGPAPAPTPSASAEPPAKPTGQDPKKLVQLQVRPGKGIEKIPLGTSSIRVREILGRPDRVEEQEDGSTLHYEAPLTIQVRVSKRAAKVTRIRVGKSWKGKTPGGVGIGDPLARVIEERGGAELRVETTPDAAEGAEHGKNKVVYRVRGDGARHFVDGAKGIRYWANPYGVVVAMAVFRAHPSVSNHSSKVSERKAIERSVEWAELVDAAKYGASWDAAAASFREKVTRNDWLGGAERQRAKIGTHRSRKVRSAGSTRMIVGAQPGHYFVIKFDSVFEKRPRAVESITAMLEEDGQWRVAGYEVK